MRQFAIDRVQILVDALIFDLHHALQLQDEDAVHKMRTGIRRLQQALRAFAQYLPEAGVKRVRKQLKTLMDHAGEVRNRDIAIELLSKAGYSTEELVKQRSVAKLALAQVLRSISRPDLSLKWRWRLGLV